MAGLVGSSNNPVSGITIGTILFASLVLIVLMGSDAPLGPVAAIMIGAVVCCAAAVAGDNLQDLKCGYMIGATPWRQQVMLAIGAISCALVMAPVLNLLNETLRHRRADGGASESAAGAAGDADGLGGERNVRWRAAVEMIWIGAAIGAAIIIIDEILKKRGANFRAPVLAAAVGIYLPLDLTVPIFLGGLLAHLVERARRQAGGSRRDHERIHRKRRAVLGRPDHGRGADGHRRSPFFVWKFKNPDVMALPERFQFGELLGVIVFAVIGWLLYRVAIEGARRVCKGS